MKYIVAFFAGMLIAGGLAVLLYFAPLGGPAAMSVPEYEPTEFARDYTPPEHRNAAIRYIEFASSMDRLTEPMNQLPSLRRIEEGEPIDPAAADEFVRNSGFNELLHNASRLHRCDWEQDLEAGADSNMPWLSIMNRFGKILIYSGEIAADRGNHDQALRDYAAALRVAQHVSQDGLFVSANASSRQVLRVLDRVEARVDFERVGESASEEWLEALGRFEDDDLFGLRAGVETNVEWIVRVSGFDVIRREEGNVAGFGTIEVPDERMLPRSAADHAVVRDLMEGARRWKTDMLKALGLEGEQRVDAVRGIGAAVDDGAYAPNDRRTLPSLNGVVDQAAEASAALEAARRSTGIAP